MKRAKVQLKRNKIKPSNNRRRVLKKTHNHNIHARTNIFRLRQFADIEQDQPQQQAVESATEA